MATNRAVSDWLSGLIERALAVEGEIVTALVRSQIKAEGTSRTPAECDEMIARAIEAARAAWPAPVGQQVDD